jgi:hypothetical protein
MFKNLPFGHPHVRGENFPSLLGTNPHRFTPTCVGNTLEFISQTALTVVHPTCVGNTQLALLLADILRFTPRAWKYNVVVLRTTDLAGHPHVVGEYTLGFQ